MVRIKICGITNKPDAIAAAGLGIDMLGFVFYENSKRFVEPALAEDIANELPPNILKVGVFVDENPERVAEIAEDVGLDMLQFHGNESVEYCAPFQGRRKIIKAFRLKSKADLVHINDYLVDFYLLDTYKTDSIGGTGDTFEWGILKDFELLRPVILSGGLKPDNVADAIKEVMPYGVDVSTGVEAWPGKKEIRKMKRFVENVRKTE